jgi:hypothetical protein
MNSEVKKVETKVKQGLNMAYTLLNNGNSF